jgi:hypothetical protein
MEIVSVVGSKEEWRRGHERRCTGAHTNKVPGEEFSPGTADWQDHGIAPPTVG